MFEILRRNPRLCRHLSKIKLKSSETVSEGKTCTYGIQMNLLTIFLNHGIGTLMSSFHLSLSHPLPQPVEPQPNVFFPNYELTKENLNPKITDNICIDSLCQQYKTVKGAKTCFQLRKNDKNSFSS